MELGSPAWLAAVADALRASEDYRSAGAGWRWPLGLAFLADDDEDVDRYVVLDLADGEVRGTQVVDRAAYLESDFRMSAPIRCWRRLFSGGLDPMRCLVLKQVRLEGDRLTALRYLPASKAMLNAMATVALDDAPARSR